MCSAAHCLFNGTGQRATASRSRLQHSTGAGQRMFRPHAGTRWLRTRLQVMLSHRAPERDGLVQRPAPVGVRAQRHGRPHGAPHGGHHRRVVQRVRQAAHLGGALPRLGSLPVPPYTKSRLPRSKRACMRPGRCPSIATAASTRVPRSAIACGSPAAAGPPDLITPCGPEDVRRNCVGRFFAHAQRHPPVDKSADTSAPCSEARVGLGYSQTPAPARAQERDPRAYQAFLQVPGGAAFLACTPEQLFARTGRSVASEAVAATRARGPPGARRATSSPACAASRGPRSCSVRGRRESSWYTLFSLRISGGTVGSSHPKMPLPANRRSALYYPVSVATCTAARPHRACMLVCDAPNHTLLPARRRRRGGRLLAGLRPAAQRQGPRRVRGRARLGARRAVGARPARPRAPAGVLVSSADARCSVNPAATESALPAKPRLSHTGFPPKKKAQLGALQNRRSPRRRASGANSPAARPQGLCQEVRLEREKSVLKQGAVPYP